MIINKGLVIIDFHAEWCAPCQQMRPIIKAVKETNQDIKFLDLDVDVNPELAERFNVRSIPTLLLLKEGTEAHRTTGVYTEKGLKRIITEKMRR